MCEVIATLYILLGNSTYLLLQSWKDPILNLPAFLAPQTWAVTSSWPISCPCLEGGIWKQCSQEAGKGGLPPGVDTGEGTSILFPGSICIATPQTAATTHGQNFSKLFFTLPQTVWLVDVLSTGSGQNLFLLLAVKILTVICYMWLVSIRPWKPSQLWLSLEAVPIRFSSQCFSSGLT